MTPSLSGASGGGGVSQILAGDGVGVSPPGGEGVVTVSATGVVQTRTVSIPSAEVLALNTTTIELAPAPPSGSMILVTSVFASLSGVGTPYATHTNLGGYFGSTLTLAFQLTDLLSQTVDSVATTDFNSLYDGFALVASDANGAALNLAVGDGNPTDGDGNLSVTVTYQVIALA